MGPVHRCLATHEHELRARGFARVAGVDEVGRGALFGAVAAAAVVLRPGNPIPRLNDSKQLTPECREELAVLIQERAECWAVAEVDAGVIDRINIYQASRMAMKRAVEQLVGHIDYLIIDAMALDLPLAQLPLIKADERCHAVAAASILAKVWRDAKMREYDEVYPAYGLARHKGYGCPEHLRALRAHGPTPLHRLSFAPVRTAGFRIGRPA
jgi:ribonuclease HII